MKTNPERLETYVERIRKFKENTWDISLKVIIDPPAHASPIYKVIAKPKTQVIKTCLQIHRNADEVDVHFVGKSAGEIIFELEKILAFYEWKSEKDEWEKKQHET
jgi:hypothetical protein